MTDLWPYASHFSCKVKKDVVGGTVKCVPLHQVMASDTICKILYIISSQLLDAHDLNGTLEEY